MRGSEKKVSKRWIIVCLAGVAVCSAALLLHWLPIARQEAFYESIATPQPRGTYEGIQNDSLRLFFYFVTYMLVGKTLQVIYFSYIRQISCTRHD